MKHVRNVQYLQDKFLGHQTKPSLHRGSSGHLKIASGSTTYTEEEKKVLLHSSHINDKEFVPFMDVDLLERFQYAIPFTDKDGLLALAPKQKATFTRWCRPEELFSDPKMLMGHYVDYYSIKQTVSYINYINIYNYPTIIFII